MLFSVVFPFSVVISLLFSAVFIFYVIIVDLVPNKWYQRTFFGHKPWVIFFQGRDIFWCLKATMIYHSSHKSTVKESYMQELQVVLKRIMLGTLVTLVSTPFEW
jgi:hypothetical protein